MVKSAVKRIGGVRAHWVTNPVVEVAGMRIAPLIATSSSSYRHPAVDASRSRRHRGNRKWLVDVWHVDHFHSAGQRCCLVAAIRCADRHGL
jgi:hypothetical protein